MPPSRQRGHFPLSNAFTKLFSGIFTGFIPQHPDHNYGEVREYEKIEDTRIYTGCDSRIAIAEIIFKRRAAHGALSHGVHGNSKEQKQTEQPLFHL
jgi:hypothetical protein